MSGWIGVDLDGTLAHYDGWKGGDHIGEPIRPMVERVCNWLEQGREVRIFTARVGRTGKVTILGGKDDEDFATGQRKLIQEWCLKHIGIVLEVTATKDFGMIELWDDRCVQVIPNTGNPIRR